MQVVLSRRTSAMPEVSNKLLAAVLSEPDVSVSATSPADCADRAMSHRAINDWLFSANVMTATSAHHHAVAVPRLRGRGQCASVPIGVPRVKP